MTVGRVWQGAAVCAVDGQNGDTEPVARGWSFFTNADDGSRAVDARGADPRYRAAIVLVKIALLDRIASSLAGFERSSSTYIQYISTRIIRIDYSQDPTGYTYLAPPNLRDLSQATADRAASPRIILRLLTSP